ncbi:MAG TPA: 4-hydroxythreonine-4-phosphate dehydrogenase PdxA [Bacteroidales bacterium]|nr:4-hydroxythreonine-4-phosphate dehydrogenase PdxA [Bacteroidales bacterium]HSA43162.1 4-hydroxythreonine-4-phosphate dehydrogenase PdxA [Bacteroidales bacterium]
MTDSQEKEKRLRLGITHGDINGISYEIIMKSLMDQRMLDQLTPVVYGTAKVASYYRKVLNINDFSFNIVRKADQAHPRKPNLVNLMDQEIKIDLGQSTPVAGELALMALEAATADLMAGHIDALVTAPINKKNIQTETFTFPGHTEYLAMKFRSDSHLMLMVGPNLRIGVVTGHMPLKDVPASLTVDLIMKRIRVMNQSVIRDFGIPKPKIALLGVNPHGGEDGLLGAEEQQVIMPAIEKARQEGMLVFGPFPADGFFGFGDHLRYDGVLAMYHDQGLIPFKTMSYHEGVNFTAGLPYIRTSPAHGTAYALAGKNEANPDSMRHAIYLATDLYRNRIASEELLANAASLNVQECNTDNQD